MTVRSTDPLVLRQGSVSCVSGTGIVAAEQVAEIEVPAPAGMSPGSERSRQLEDHWHEKR